jgi:hypothetical protein
MSRGTEQVMSGLPSGDSLAEAADIASKETQRAEPFGPASSVLNETL